MVGGLRIVLLTNLMVKRSLTDKAVVSLGAAGERFRNRLDALDDGNQI
jgi:hypothetical protein